MTKSPVIKTAKFILSYSILSASLINYASAETTDNTEPNADERFIYAGVEFGISDPIWKKFDHVDEKKRKTKIGLKKSHMMGGRIGYGFYPNMMLEISGTHQPKYNLSYVLPEVDLGNGITVPSTPGKTKVSGNVYTLNMIYKLDSLSFAGVQPYVIGGLGFGTIKISSTSSNPEVPIIGSTETFRVNKTKQNVSVYQFGVGLSKSAWGNFEFDVAAKFQIFQNIRIKYNIRDMQAFPAVKFGPTKSIKKTIAVGEFTVGMIYKIPM